ncbi:hypothetical protein ACTPEF_24470, partial [Clostridioides difficile]
VSMVTILISAYIPARKAANTPVMECIRQTNEVKIESKSVKTSGIIISLIGIPIGLISGTVAIDLLFKIINKYFTESVVTKMSLQ